MSVEFKQCPLCKFSGNFEVVISSNHFAPGQILRHACTNCDVVFGSNCVYKGQSKDFFAMGFEELGNEYKKLYASGYQDGDCTYYETKAFQTLQPTKDQIYLNWGAGGVSNTIGSLRADGYHICGYDPFCKPRPNVAQNFSEIENLRFAGIISNDLIEHVKDPVATLLTMKSLLTPNGKMAHSTSNWQFLHDYTPFHFWFFLGRSVQVMCEQAGLQVADVDEYIKVFWAK